MECKCSRCGKPFPYRFIAENLSDRWISPDAYELWAAENINYCPDCQEEFLKNVCQCDPEFHPDVDAFAVFDRLHGTSCEETIARIEIYRWCVSALARRKLHAEALELIMDIREKEEDMRRILHVAENQRNFLKWVEKSGAKDPTVETIAAYILDTTGDIDLAIAVYLEDTHLAAEVIAALRNPEFFKLLLTQKGIF